MSTKNWLGISVIILIFGMMVIGCSTNFIAGK